MSNEAPIEWNAYFDHERAHAAPGPVGGSSRPAVPAIYDVPAHRVLLDPIPSEAEEPFRAGLEKTYGGLSVALPLTGSAALAPTAEDGLALCEALRAALPWLGAAISLIERQLRVAIWAGRPWLQLRPMCLVGPPGSGKSYLAREIGRLSGVAGAQLDLGGTHDADALTATSRGWSTAKPCWPVVMVNSLRVANPILVLDELDKAGGSARNGIVKEAVLGMLEPGTAAVFFDTCLMARVDLSAVNWIATANEAGRLDAPLRSRLDLVEAPAPSPEHFDLLVDRLLVATAVRWGLLPADMPDLPTRAVRALRAAFARHRSLRRLGRDLQDVLSGLVGVRRKGLH